MLHGGFCPFWAPQDTPGSTLATITQVFFLSSPPGLHSGLTGSVWVAWLPHFQVSVLHGGFCPFWAPQDTPGSTLVTIPQVFILSLPPELYPRLTGSVWVAWLPHFQVSMLHCGFYPFWAPRTPQAQPWLQSPEHCWLPHALGPIFGYLAVFRLPGLPIFRFLWWTSDFARFGCLRTPQAQPWLQ